MYGGITHHYVGSKLPYCNTINNYGTIHNEYVAVLAGNQKYRAGILRGKDSACGNIYGGIGAANVSQNVDFVLGGYNTNFDKFHERNIEPPTYKGITPVMGVDFRIPIYSSKQFSIKIDNLISVGIVTHSFSIDF